MCCQIPDFVHKFIILDVEALIIAFLVCSRLIKCSIKKKNDFTI